MTQEDRIQYAFTAGEVSSFYANRSDLNKYDLGLFLCKNFFVDPRGGISTRIGTELVGPAQGGTDNHRLIRFRGTENDVLLLFGGGYMRVISDGGYVLEETAINFTATAANPAVFTSASHGLVESDDWVYIDSMSVDSPYTKRVYRVDAVTTNTFQLRDPGFDLIDGTTFDGAITGTVYKVYRLNTPFLSADLAGLSFEQSQNQVRISSLDYPRYRLNYSALNNWSLVAVSSGTTLAAPENITLTASATDDASIAVVVTAVNRAGRESVGSEYALIQDSVNYAATEGTLQITWDPVPGAVKYNIYRSVIIPGTAEVTKGEIVGYIGSSYGAQFTDTNIIPDFTKTPPVHVDPFAAGAINFISVTDGGTGYAKSDTITVSGGGGTGFDGYPIVSDDGKIIGVSIVNGGSGYSSPVTVSVTTSGGSDAEFDVEVGPADGVNPRLFKVFQRRGIYMGTENLPNSFWASHPGAYNNYDHGTVITDADPYEFTIDSVAVKPIKHAVALRSGLLLFNDDGVTQLRAENGKAVTGNTAIAEPQVYASVSDVPPLAYNLDVLFSTMNSTTVYAMLYTEYTESFKLQDLSILSSHLIGPGKEIKRFVSTRLPANLIYMPRSDGRELSLTYLREQEVFAWAWHETQGYILDTEVIEENGVSVKYQIVRRFLRGAWRSYVERSPVRDDSLPENYWGVDCGLKYPTVLGTVGLSCDTATGEGVMTAASSFFTSIDIGKIIYYAGGKFEITGYTSGTVVTGTWLRDASDVLPQRAVGIPREALAGEWEIATPTSTITGLWHLEGETVSINADGDAYTGIVVENGTVTLTAPATKIYVGLPYVCDFKTIPIVSNQFNIAGKPKKIFTVFPRMYASRGMQFGTSFDNLYETKDRSDEAWGEELALRSDVSELLLTDEYTLEKFLCGRQDKPLPGTVLGYTAELDIGDS